MVEKKEIIKKQVSYEGLFDVKDLYKTIKDWGIKNGYDLEEAEHAEVVQDARKEIKFVLFCEKKISDYVKLKIEFHTKMEKIQEVTVKQEKGELKLNKGSVSVTTKGIFITDYDNKWVKSAIHIMMKAIHDKFINKAKIDMFESQLIKEVDEGTYEVSNFLNLYKYNKESQ